MGRGALGRRGGRVTGSCAPRMPLAYEQAAARLGWCSIMLKQYPEAIAALKDAIRLRPSDSEAQENLGWVYNEIG